MKNFCFFREDTKEILCENIKDQKEITEFLHDLLIKIRQNFVDKVFQKTKTDNEIKELQAQIEMRKDDVELGFENNRYINIDKRRVYLENTNLTKSNKTFNDKEFVLKFAKNSYKKDLFSNLTLFCDKVEDYCLGIFEKFFIIFIKNLKNY